MQTYEPTIAEKPGPGEQTGPATMRAIVQHSYGGSEALQMADVELPEIASDEVLVEVVAAGIDRGAWHLVTGMPYLIRLLGYGFSRPKNPVPGMDVAGRVVAVGDEVTRFQVGDEAFGIADGAYAQYAAAPEAKLAHKPANLTFEQAGVAAVSGMTALQGLTDVGHLEPGQRVLVVGASGGVGSYAVQIAKALGAHVTGVCSGAKAELVRSLGADEVIDYATTDYLNGASRYDLIIDIGGRNPVRVLRRALTRTGTLVMTGGEGGGRFTGGIGRQLRGVAWSPFVSQRLAMFISEEHHRHMERLAEFFAAGTVTPAVGQRYRLDEVPQAIADLEAGRASGKSVVLIGGGDVR